MAKSSSTVCRAAGCFQRADGGLCRKCEKLKTRKHAGQMRGTANARGYTAAWNRLSKRFRQANPLCLSCDQQGRAIPADLVDHIVPVDIDRGRRLDWSNLQSLCRKCHAEKTEQDRVRYLSQRLDTLAAAEKI